ncbi:MAG: isoprenylcysteine carboxylmethyltransferase family protein [Thermoanaerobaculales bacterium]|jgi:protein-S-isoprenylcysteine O-methyltransferase Ste14|nr:isoprenylcysteine carboxylmethyltransferase family protein [Thermoanaerobaculales bacterium]
MNRIVIFAYGIVSYAVGMASLLYGAGWLGNIGVPRSIDSARDGGLGVALLLNLALLALFVVQHSVMARPAFKRWWTRIIPPAAERSTYVLLSGLALGLLMWLWQPMGGVVWSVESTAGAAVLYGLYGLGWTILVASTFMLNHFDLFGLRQVWLALRGRPYTRLEFATPALYRVVRHPIYVGWITLMWATPTMTVAHLVFALASTTYILVAMRIEERDLVAEHGRRYTDYRDRVPALVPFGGRRAVADGARRAA